MAASSPSTKNIVTYCLGDLHFMLDELPYGDFFEIEEDDVASIRETASQLHLRWDTAVKMNYLETFQRLCEDENLDATHLIFEALSKEKAYLVLFFLLTK